MIVANLVGDGKTFGKDNNAVEVFWRQGGSKSFALQAKNSLAKSLIDFCLLYTSPSPRDKRQSRMPSSA